MKRVIRWTIYLSVMMLPFSAFGTLPLKGDVNNNGSITLQDAIMALQIASSTNAGDQVFSAADVNGDNKIGIAEAIYILQCISELRIAGDGGGSGLVCVWDSALWDSCLWGQ